MTEYNKATSSKLALAGKEVCMAKFVPLIIKTDDSQSIGVKIVRMKKSDAIQTEKEPVWQTSWLSIMFGIMELAPCQALVKHRVTNSLVRQQ